MSDSDPLLDLDNQVCFALYSASRLFVRAYRELLDELGLTYPQYLVMLVLWEWAHHDHQRSTVSALGDRLDLDSGTLTPLLRRLEEKGFVARNRSGVDEREVLVKLTDAGLKLQVSARRVPLALVEKSPLPVAEMLALRDQLNRVRARLAASDT